MLPFCQGNKQRLVCIILTGQTCTNAGRETKQSSIPTIPLFHYLAISIYHSNKPKYNCRWIYLQWNKLQILHLWVFLCASSCHNGRLVTAPVAALGLTSVWDVKHRRPGPTSTNLTSRTQWQNLVARSLPSRTQCCGPEPDVKQAAWLNPFWLTGCRSVYLCCLIIKTMEGEIQRIKTTIEIRTKHGCLYLHQWLH